MTLMECFNQNEDAAYENIMVKPIDLMIMKS